MSVNALNGLFPFLLYYRISKILFTITVCQRPKRALSISTVFWVGSLDNALISVNALNGLFPFLQ